MIPILVLILGAAGLLAGLQPRFRFAGVLGALTAFFAMVSLALKGLRLPEINIVSNWKPAALFPEPLAFRIDALAWLMGLAVLTATLAVFLTGLARGGGRRLAPRGATLLITAATLAAIFAADLVTLAIAWAGLDLLYFLALVALSEGDERQAVLSLGFNTAATLLVVAAAVTVTSAGGHPAFGEMPFGPRATLLLALAAVFRLGLFPLHLGLPVEANVRQGLGTILRLAPAAIALVLVARLIGATPIGAAVELSSHQTLPLRPWLTVGGVAALWVGASQWWVAPDPRQGLTFFVIAQSGLALLTGLWGGSAALAGLAAQSLALVLGGAVIFLFNGHDDQSAWHTTLPGAAVAALVGVPFLTGFTGQWALYTGLLAQGNYWVLSVSAAAQIVLVAGFLRLCFWPADEPLQAG
ncbi:MAG: hypothetical protein HY260_10825 [Chloroflexi bacterium]|nr:hypothetical protein [Chloroflexota bacterium]